MGHSKHKETLEPYHYTSNQLITMSNKLKDNKYCILPFDTINKIGELGLNKHKARKYNRYLHKPKMVNTKNLIQINTTKKNNSNNIRIATMNTRSVKYKQLQIIKIVELQQNIDFIMLTETWLKNTKTKHG